MSLCNQRTISEICQRYGSSTSSLPNVNKTTTILALLMQSLTHAYRRRSVRPADQSTASKEMTHMQSKHIDILEEIFIGAYAMNIMRHRQGRTLGQEVGILLVVHGGFGIAKKKYQASICNTPEQLQSTTEYPAAQSKVNSFRCKWVDWDSFLGDMFR